MSLRKLMAGCPFAVFMVWAFIGLASAVKAAPALVITDQDDSVHIGHPYSYLIDDPGQISHQDVATNPQLPWLESSSENIHTNRDNYQRQIFVRIQLESHTSGHYTLTHDFTFDPITEVKLLHISPEGILVKDSFFKPKPTFELTLQPGLHTLIFVLTNNPFELTKIRFRFMKSTTYALRNFSRGNIYGVIFGLALAMCFYNLSMFYFFRNMYFLYYCPYVLGFATILAFGAGSIPYSDMNLFWRLPIIISAIFLFLFKSSALNLKTYTPRIYKVFAILTVLHVISMTLSILGLVGGTSLIFAPFLIFIAITSAFVRTRQGYKPAVFFVYGWSIFFLGFIVGFLQLAFPIHSMFHFSGFIGFAFEIILFSFATSYKTRLQENKINQENEHAFRQLQKVFYPHQISQIKSAAELESTMPTHAGVACVISFDIIASTTIQHEKTKDFFRNVFRRCNEIMMSNYDPQILKANAYRIKEMGDGFLCSVGYPFQSRTGFMAKDALDVALMFHKAFQEEVEKFGYRDPIYCALGIALDHITGFYPETGTKEYDLYGKAIVLATRYEGMRKVIFSKINTSVLIIQSKVFLSLDGEQANSFKEYNLHANGLAVRDDPTARKLYYKHLPGTQENQDGSTLLEVFELTG